MNRPEPDLVVRPHPLANEMTDASFDPATEEIEADRASVLPRAERRIAWRGAWWVGGFLVLALIVGVVLFPQPEIYVAGVAFILLYGLVLISPVILADATKVAQDEAIKAARRPPSPPRAPDSAPPSRQGRLSLHEDPATVHRPTLRNRRVNPDVTPPTPASGLSGPTG